MISRQTSSSCEVTETDTDMEDTHSGLNRKMGLRDSSKSIRIRPCHRWSYISGHWSYISGHQKLSPSALPESLIERNLLKIELRDKIRIKEEQFQLIFFCYQTKNLLYA
jgi:hypothetical protein